MLGFVGCGNMAQAMITGILTQKVVSPQELIVSNPREEKTAKLKDEFGIITTTDNKEVAKQSDILVLSVKPQVYSLYGHALYPSAEKPFSGGSSRPTMHGKRR